MPAPNTSIENFTSEEKSRLVSFLRKKMLMKSFMYLSIIAGIIFVLVYFNYLSGDAENENLGLLNIAFIIMAAFPARILFIEFLDYRTETRSAFKKIVLTRIVKSDGNKITIGNQQFNKEDIILDASVFDDLQAGDPVRVEHSAKSHIIFSVKRI